jgi:branched-chain amino acid transport system substrate-binding protein
MLAVGSTAAIGSAATDDDSTGVTDDAVKIGYIFSETGLAGSTFKNAGKACQARVDRENAKGGVNGRTIELEIVDDQSSANKTAAEDLVQNKNVFMVINNSSFAFLAREFLLDAGVPVIGGGYDGTYYGEPGNEDIISASGNAAPVSGVTYDGLPKLMKKMGGTKVAALAYGVSASSTAAAQNLQKFAVPSQGLEAVYTNTTVDFGTTDVGPLVLGIKNSGADAAYLPMVASSNFAVVTGLAQNNVDMKSLVLATGYGQDLLDNPIADTLGPSVVLSTGYAPVELKTKATKQFQADLKKYAGLEGVPDYGQQTGYITCDMMIQGLKAAGENPTRRGFIDGLRGLGTYDQAGLACRPVDISLEGYGTAAPTACGWFVQVEDGKFVLFPKNGKPIESKLLEESTTATTTTEAPAS